MCCKMYTLYNNIISWKTIQDSWIQNSWNHLISEIIKVDWWISCAPPSKEQFPNTASELARGQKCKQEKKRNACKKQSSLFIFVLLYRAFGVPPLCICSRVRSRFETYNLIVQIRVSVQGVESLWGDCRFIPADWGSQ